MRERSFKLFKNMLTTALAVAVSVQAGLPSIVSASPNNNHSTRSQSHSSFSNADARLFVERLSNVTGKSVLDRIAKKYGLGTRTFRSRMADGSQELAKTTSEAVGHQVQAMLMMMIISGVAVVKSNVERAQLENRPVTKSELEKEILHATEAVLVNGTMWFGFAGGSASSSVLSRPTAYINGLIGNAVTRPIMRDLIQSGIRSFVMFIGWELGSQLFREASDMNNVNDVENKRAQDIIPLIAQASAYRATGGAHGSKSDWLLLQKLFRNMVSILLIDNNLRDLWFYNTWRTRIATGDFASLILSMSVATAGATAAGTMIFPGGGTVVGFAFGLIGGVSGGLLSLFTPQPIKDGLTSFLQSRRRDFSTAQNYFAEQSQTHVADLLHAALIEHGTHPPLRFNPDKNGIEHMVGITFEKLYLYETQLSKIIGRRDTAHGHNQDLYEKLNAQVPQVESRYLRELARLDSYYADEINRLDAVYRKYPEFLDPKNIALYPALQQMVDYQTRLVQFQSFFSNDFTPAVRSQMNSLTGKTYLAALYKIYIFGFHESELLDAMNTSN